MILGFMWSSSSGGELSGELSATRRNPAGCSGDETECVVVVRV